MTKRIMDRRTFLQTAGKTTAMIVVASGSTTIMASNRAWAMTLEALDAHEAQILLRMTRLLYPHDGLGDVYYAEVVEALDGKAAKDAALRERIRQGVAGMDEALGVPWLELSEGTRIEVLEAIESTPFFQAVRGHTVVALYDNKLIWPQFGYQGSSWQDGGYLLRGFQDAGWTMQPDEQASPPPFLG